MNKDYAGQLFDKYINRIILDKSIEEAAAETFQEIYELVQEKDDIVEVINHLHAFLRESNMEYMIDIVEQNDELDEAHLIDINKTKKQTKHSRDVIAHLKDNLEFFIGIQSSDGDMIDFIRSVL